MYMGKMDVRLAAVEARSKSNSHRLDEVDRKLQDNEKMLTSIALIAERQDNMDGDLKEIKNDVKILTAKPAKRWESVTEKILLLVVTAFVTYILTKCGLPL